jgi:hypothetical protein
MPLSGAPLLGIVALWGAVGVVVAGLVLLLLLIVVVVVRCVVDCAWAPPPLPLWSEPQAANSRAAAIAVTDAIRFIGPHDREARRHWQLCPQTGRFGFAACVRARS